VDCSRRRCTTMKGRRILVFTFLVFSLSVSLTFGQNRPQPMIGVFNQRPNQFGRLVSRNAPRHPSEVISETDPLGSDHPHPSHIPPQRPQQPSIMQMGKPGPMMKPLPPQPQQPQPPKMGGQIPPQPQNQHPPPPPPPQPMPGKAGQKPPENAPPPHPAEVFFPPIVNPIPQNPMPDLKANSHALPHIIAGGQPFVVQPSPHKPKEGEAPPGGNLWNKPIEELQELVHQFRKTGIARLPNGEVIINPKMHSNAALVNTPNGKNVDNKDKCQGPNCPKPPEGENAPPPPPPNQETGGSTTTEEPSTSTEANRRRTIQANLEEAAIITTVTQTSAKHNFNTACEAFVAQNPPPCVAQHKWEEIFRQEIDCAPPKRKREWRCYCGFFEDENIYRPSQQLPPQPLLPPVQGPGKLPGLPGR